MKHRTNKIAAMFVVSIFALTGVATGYAMWSQDLTIDGSVTTGVLDWEWYQTISVLDPHCPPPYHPTQFPDWNVDPDDGLNAGQPFLSDKNVGCGSITLIDQHTLELTINNAYPGYYNEVTTHVHGLGTIPLKIHSVIFSYDAQMTDIITTIYANQLVEIDLDKDGVVDCQIKWLDNFGLQMHNCDEAEISFKICFLQPLQQTSTFNLYIALRGVQWNEYVAGPIP